MKKLKIIMIDAFKPDYLKHAPYLSSLTKKLQWGELEMPIGHGGGMEIFFQGNSDVLATFYKKENSSLKWIKNFFWIEKFGKAGRFFLDCIINFIRLLNGKELHRTGKIPLKQLWKMEMHDSKKVYKKMNVKYYYISELDRIGHKYGTDSPEIIEEIKKIDKKISKMNFDAILSDHGMMNVEKIISVPKTDDCIIDSDMARYWGKKPNFESKDGKWIEWKGKQFGEYIFLANPGVLIFPNYWDYAQVKGMHGYDGKSPYMKAIYILNKKGKKKNLEVKNLHEILKKFLII